MTIKQLSHLKKLNLGAILTAVTVALLLSLACTGTTAAPTSDITAVEAFISTSIAENRIPGLAAVIVRDGEIAYAKGFGFADQEREVPMTPDTLMNIGSVSKTFVNTAILQLVERGALDLEDDVNRYLSFQVAHPRHPESAITVRQLLTHTASIRDGDAYGASYACGDPAIPLVDWIQGYLAAGGRFYDAGNFHPWPPGTVFSYSNVGYGLLGLLVEVISGEPFAVRWTPKFGQVAKRESRS